MSDPKNRLIFTGYDGTTRDEITPDTWTYTRPLRGAGELTGVIGMRHPKATARNFSEGRTLIYHERAGQIRWGGLLDEVDPSTRTRSAQFRAASLWSFIERLKLTNTLDFDAVDQLDIVRSLVAAGMADPRRLLTFELGTELSGRTRFRDYQGYEFVNVGAAILDLADNLDGFDVQVYPRWENGQIVHHLRLDYPRRGGQSLVRFVLGTNLEHIETSRSARALVTRALAIGAGDGDAMITTESVDTGDGRYPLVDGTTIHKDTRRLDNLEGKAGALLDARKRPVVTYDLTFDVSPATPETDPQTGGWTLGDDIGVYADDGLIQVDERCRIVSESVTVRSGGDETVTLTVVPTTAFSYGGA